MKNQQEVFLILKMNHCLLSLLSIIYSIILLNKLQSYYISTVLPSVSQISSSLSIPIIQMVPSTSAFYSRFANAVIQAFVSLFMIVDNNTQNRMIEYALSTISKSSFHISTIYEIELADKELKDIYINNFCCILWNITQVFNFNHYSL